MPAGGTLTIETTNITGRRSAARRSAAPPGHYVRLRVRTPGRACPTRRSTRIRAVLHHQGGGHGNRARPGHRLRDRHPGRTPHLHLLRARLRHHLHHHAPVTDEATISTSDEPELIERPPRRGDRPGRGGRTGALREATERIFAPATAITSSRLRVAPMPSPSSPASTRVISTCCSPMSSCRRCSGKEVAARVQLLSPRHRSAVHVRLRPTRPRLPG